METNPDMSVERNLMTSVDPKKLRSRLPQHVTSLPVLERVQEHIPVSLQTGPPALESVTTIEPQILPPDGYPGQSLRNTRRMSPGEDGRRSRLPHTAQMKVESLSTSNLETTTPTVQHNREVTFSDNEETCIFNKDEGFRERQLVIFKLFYGFMLAVINLVHQLFFASTT